MRSGSTPPETTIEAAMNAAKRTITFTPVKLSAPVRDADAAAHLLPADDPSLVAVTLSGIVDGTVHLAVGDEFCERLGYANKTKGALESLRPTIDALLAPFRKLGPVQVEEPVEADRGAWPGEAATIISASMSADGEVVISIALALSYEPATTEGRLEPDGESFPVPDPAATTSTTAVSGALADEMARLADIEVELTAVLGETTVPLHELLGWLPGSIILLARHAGTPAELRVDDTIVARGDVVSIDEMYGVRISDLAMATPTPTSGVSGP